MFFDGTQASPRPLKRPMIEDLAQSVRILSEEIEVSPELRAAFRKNQQGLKLHKRHMACELVLKRHNIAIKPGIYHSVFKASAST